MHRNNPIGQQNPSIPRRKETLGNQVHVGEIQEPEKPTDSIRESANPIALDTVQDGLGG